MTNKNNSYDVIVIGAGVAGIYQIKRLKDMGLNAILLESDEDLGGTWYRNRYPGCRFDSESYSYGYSFSDEILQEWHWKERFSSQPENLKYLKFVADKFALRSHMKFNARVNEMIWDEAALRWRLVLDNGETLITRFVITCVGILSAPTPPRFKGMDDFKGDAFHTYWWPKEPVELAGRRVGVIGTGATGIQVIAEIADKVDTLTVFQRRPNWSTPLNNSSISESEMHEIRSKYDEIFAKCGQSAGGFVHVPDKRGFWSVSPEERRAYWDELYDTPGFAILQSNFVEIFTDEEANREMSDYVADRIRARVNDPKIAEKLIPKDHGFGMQRLPLETKYYETYNRDNVDLVDVTETPIECITETGIQTSEQHYDLDLIVYATGFNAVTGAFDRLNIRGSGGVNLADKWRDGPLTYYGLLTHGFPNLLMVAGPQSVSGSTNYPRAIEAGVDWVTRFVSYTLEKGYERFESQPEAEQAWKDEVVRAHEKLLLRRSKGWFTGYNSNIDGREVGKVRYQSYFGPAPKYKKLITQIADDGYPQIEFA